MAGRIHRVALVASFWALLCIPGLKMLVRPEAPDMYGVKVVAYPPFEASFPWLGHFEEYFTANLGYKKRLVQLSNFLGYRVWHDLQSDNVLVGRNGWLFLKQDYGWDSFRSEAPPSPLEAREWRKALQGAQSFLSSRGIPLLYVIVPSKESIYPDRLPAGAVRARSTTRLDEMLPLLAQAKIDYIDLRPALREARKNAQIYDTVDSHWNGLGAKVGAEQILSRVAAILGRANSFTALNSHIGPRESFGDLPLILSLDGIVTAQSVELVADQSRAQRLEPPESVAEPTRKQMNRMVFEVPDETLPKALILRDSFAEMFTATLAEKFQRSIWLWTHELDLRTVSRENPDIVIVELTERFFSGKPPKLTTDAGKHRN